MIARDSNRSISRACVAMQSVWCIMREQSSNEGLVVAIYLATGVSTGYLFTQHSRTCRLSCGIVYDYTSNEGLVVRAVGRTVGL